MTESQLRERVVDLMRGWCGATKGSTTHYNILNVYNSHKPLARGYAIKPYDDYCAATASAAWIGAGVASVAVTEVSVPKMVTLAQQAGIWVESDAYRPQPGDAIIYDWQDSGSGDNHGSPDHVGIVERVDGGGIHVIEGNMSGGRVGRRTVPVNGRYIRGFVCPRFSRLATGAATSAATATVATPAKNLTKESVCEVTVPVLKKGSKSGYVKTLQILLNKYNRANIAEDGVFGAGTERAVVAYQKSRGLGADGVVGAQTWAQLIK
jgi:hypothetical protein